MKHCKESKNNDMIASGLIFSWTAEYTVYPIRLAGTIRIYSKKAMPQLMRIALHIGICGSFK